MGSLWRGADLYHRIRDMITVFRFGYIIALIDITATKADQRRPDHRPDPPVSFKQSLVILKLYTGLKLLLFLTLLMWVYLLVRENQI